MDKYNDTLLEVNMFLFCEHECSFLATLPSYFMSSNFTCHLVYHLVIVLMDTRGQLRERTSAGKHFFDGNFIARLHGMLFREVTAP